MYIIFDTSILIELEKNNLSIVKEVKKLKEVYPATPKIPFIVLYEFLYGVRNRSLENKRKAKIFLSMFELLNTTKFTAEILINLKDKYEYPLADLLIASQVIENRGILVTKDRDFEGIKELDKVLI